MEVPASWWVQIFAEAKEPGRIQAETSAEEILSFLNDLSKNSILIEALATLFELGTSQGLEHLEEVAEDQGVQLGTSVAEPAREAAARLWVEAQTRPVLRQALALARLYPPSLESRRTFREFAGAEAGHRREIDPVALQEAISRWCEEHHRTGVTKVLPLRRGSERHWVVVRGDLMKREPVIRDEEMAVLDYRPALSDLLRYDPETGRLGISTASPSLVATYRNILGTLIASSGDFFAGENICSLRPLQEKGMALFKGHIGDQIIRVDVVELLWNRGRQEKLWVRSTDCFDTLDSLGAALGEGQLSEAKLKVYLAGSNRAATVTIKVPNRIEIKPPVHESVIEAFLNEVGIRGVFGDEGSSVQSLWELYPWQWTEAEWRKHLGRDFDRLLCDRLLRPCRLHEVAHPDHPAMGDILEVHAAETGHLGVSQEPAVRSRSLTASDIGGYDLDIERLAEMLKGSLEILGPLSEPLPGLWMLGCLDLSPVHVLRVLWVARQPDRAMTRQIQDLVAQERGVALVPQGCTIGIELPQVEVAMSQEPGFESLLGKIVEVMELQHAIPPRVWLRNRIDLLIDEQEGMAYFRDVPLTELKAGTQPWDYVVALASAGGSSVAAEDLRQQVNGFRDPDLIRKMKSQALKAIKASLIKAGKGTLFPDDLITVQNQRHRVTVKCHVHRAHV
jgi:hypothetical protein